MTCFHNRTRATIVAGKHLLTSDGMACRKTNHTFKNKLVNDNCVSGGDVDNRPAGLKIFMMEFDFPLHISSDIIGSSLCNCTCRNASLVNANFSVNQMCPIICRWKLVKHHYCFGDNRRTKDNRKIKLCGLKACCVT